MADFIELALDGPLPVPGFTMIEASAGTGKTTTLATLVARYVAEQEVDIGALCIVTFTEAATTELRARVRSELAALADHLDDLLAGRSGDAFTKRAADHPSLTIVGAVDDAEREVRLDRVRRALSDFDAATIATIHGFCQRVLGTAGLGQPTAALDRRGDDVVEVVNDLFIRDFTEQVTRLQPQKLAKATVLALRMEDSALDLPLPAERAKVARAVQIESTRVLRDVVGTVRERRTAGRTRSLDDLLLHTRDLLASPVGASTRATLVDRYRVVLIDEFQDTDQVQWQIFHDTFVGTGAIVIMVGDPKQAIYRFRSADINAYLSAVEAADARYTLGINWRSDARYLHALDALLSGTTFGDDNIVFRSVRPRPNDADRVQQRATLQQATVFDGTVQLRTVMPLAPDDSFSETGHATHHVVPDIVQRTGELLDAGFQPDGIAVLVRTNIHGREVADALAAAGIPATCAATESVFESDAALQWEILLRALERPNSARAARAAAIGWFVALAPEQLVAMDDDALSAVQQRVHDWARLVEQRGVPALVTELRRNGLAAHVLGRLGGDRDLTDVEHIAELLHEATRGARVTAPALLHALRQLVTDQEDEPEVYARRIESDDHAVQVMTVHKSKGLEFDAVLCPFLWTNSAASGTIPHAALDDPDDPGTMRRFLDSAWIGGHARKDVGAAQKLETEGEALRLLYVAVTRAKLHCTLWWAPVNGKGATSRSSALSRLLFSRTPDGHVDPDALGTTPESADLSVLAPTIRLADGALSLAEVRGRATPPRRSPADAEPNLSVAPFGSRDFDRSWQVWSFTRMNADASGTAAPPVPIETHEDAGALDELPTGTAANSVEPVGLDGLGVDGLDATDPSTPAPANALVGLPGGTAFGTLVHEILEITDFAAPELDLHLAALVDTALAGRGGVQIDPAALTEGLVEVVHAPLGGPVGALRLRDLSPTDRLDELAFDLAFGATLRASTIGQALGTNISPGDPFVPWTRSLTAGSFDFDLSGMLTGSIDLVFRSPAADGTTQFFVVDYKTNRLADPGAYRGAGLVDAMEHSNYPLQAALYLVALHRYLRLRLPDYDPARHLGGAAYLFVRGMRPGVATAPGQPADGVCWWQPPGAAIVALSDAIDLGWPA
jgi:exodeoxyribonuclease V beta subunit